MKLASFLLAAMVATPAFGQVPQLSGNYAIEVNVICQATPTSTGFVASRLLSLNFNNATGMLTVSGTMNYGALVLASGSPGMTSIPVSITGPYTNTATTLTADGETVPILYGAQIAGVAQSYETSGVISEGATNNCLETALAVHQ